MQFRLVARIRARALEAVDLQGIARGIEHLDRVRHRRVAQFDAEVAPALHHDLDHRRVRHEVRDAWLRRIGELLKQGKHDDAKASLAEFRRRYPDASLPPELRKLEH